MAEQCFTHNPATYAPGAKPSSAAAAKSSPAVPARSVELRRGSAHEQLEAAEPKPKPDGSGESKPEMKEPAKAEASATEAPKTNESTKSDPGKLENQYETGWSEEHLCAWRKKIMGPKSRGPIEFSQKPTVDERAEEDSSIVCSFGDGHKIEVAHITVASWMEHWYSLVGVVARLICALIHPYFLIMAFRWNP